MTRATSGRALRGGVWGVVRQWEAGAGWGRWKDGVGEDNGSSACRNGKAVWGEVRGREQGQREGNGTKFTVLRSS